MQRDERDLLIKYIIMDYYEHGVQEDHPDYTWGYADATLNMIMSLIDIDPPEVE